MASVTSKLLFLDDRHVSEMFGLSRRFGEPQACPENPVIRADTSWEKDAAFVDSGLVVFDEDDGLFKAWYQGGACYGPDDGSTMCYATSADGVHWDKPALGMVEFEGSTANNMVLRARCMMHDPAVIIDCAEPDPQQRYKAVWWGGRPDATRADGWLLGHCVGFSADGIHWSEHPDNPVWPGDAEVAIPAGIERHRGQLVMYSSIDGYGMRVAGRTESADFIDWDLPPKLVFASDDDDPPGTEMGGLCAIDYDGNHIGMLWVIHNLGGITAAEWREIVARNKTQGFFGPPITMNATRCRVMFNELVCSTDGIDWQRVHREPFLAPGGEGTWDEAISLVGRPIVARDRIYMYYTGMGRTVQTPGVEEPQKLGEWNVDTGLATLRLDGFASLDAGTGEGRLVTEPIALNGQQLEINVDAAAGAARVEVLDEGGEVIEGYSKEDQAPIVGDHLRARTTWRGEDGIRALAGRRVRLSVYLQNASLYALSLVDD